MLAAVAGYHQGVGTSPGPITIHIASALVSRASSTDAIRLIEEGPGGVSALEITVDDPGIVYDFRDGDPVLVTDQTNSRPIFRGFVKGPLKLTPYGLGRQITVRAIGIEAVLDWMIVPAITFDTSVFSWTVGDAMQSLVAQAFGIGVPLNTALSSSAVGSQDAPFTNHPSLMRTVAIPAGTTLREAIRLLLAASSTNPVSGSAPVVTVDYYGGVRMWLQLDSSGNPRGAGDYSTLTVADITPSASPQGAAPEHVTDGSDIYRQVYVIGGNAAGTGLVTDGTGIPGPVGTYSDAAILTSAARDAAGAAYLRDHRTAERGTFRLESVTVTTNIRAGSKLIFTDAQLGLSSAGYVISAIEKTFIGPTQDWRVTYGKLPPSAIRQLRRLTRNVLN